MNGSLDRKTGARVRRKALLKWAAIMSPAGAITFGLFVAMTRAVAVEYAEPTDLPTYDLEAYVETPVNLTRKQEELLREFEAESEGRNNNPEAEGFFSKVKDFWDDLRD